MRRERRVTWEVPRIACSRGVPATHTTDLYFMRWRVHCLLATHALLTLTYEPSPPRSKPHLNCPRSTLCKKIVNRNNWSLARDRSILKILNCHLMSSTRSHICNGMNDENSDRLPAKIHQKNARMHKNATSRRDLARSSRLCST